MGATVSPTISKTRSERYVLAKHYLCMYSNIWYDCILFVSDPCSSISDVDVMFIMENITKMAEHIQVVIERVKDSSQKEQIKRYFTSMGFNSC